MSFMFQFLAQFFAGFGIGFWKGWKLALVMMSLTPVLAVCGAFMSKVGSQIVVRYLTELPKLYMSSAHVLLNLLNELREKDNMLDLTRFFTTSYINSMILYYWSRNARFYLSYATKIAFDTRFSHQHFKISPLENAMFFMDVNIYNSVTKRIQVISFFLNRLVGYRF